MTEIVIPESDDAPGEEKPSHRHTPGYPPHTHAEDDIEATEETPEILAYAEYEGASAPLGQDWPQSRHDGDAAQAADPDGAFV